VKNLLGVLPDGFLSYFTTRFPELFISLYKFVENLSVREESVMKPYFKQ
jgi:serine/threonine-protein kinase/endoribonuclease IRE1